MNSFNTAHEGIHVELHTMSVPEQFNALRNGLLDVGFVRVVMPLIESGL